MEMEKDAELGLGGPRKSLGFGRDLKGRWSQEVLGVRKWFKGLAVSGRAWDLAVILGVCGPVKGLGFESGLRAWRFRGAYGGGCGGF